MNHPLKIWLRENMPELAAELAQLPIRDCRVRLNQATGLNFGPTDLMDESMDAYLAKLKEMKK